MPFHSFILASGDDAMIKVIFAIIFGIIWAISAAVSAVTKKAQEAKRRQQLSGQAPPPVPVQAATTQAQQPFKGTMTRFLGAPPPRQMPKSQPRGGKPPKGKQPKVKTQARRPSPAPPPPPIAAAHERSAMQAPPDPTTHLAGGSAGRTTVIGGSRAAANPLIKLMSPKTLRTLIITNELLKPPLALRDQWPPLG